jgi:hypothetical protein
VTVSVPRRQGDVSDKARIELGPIARKLREELDVDDDDWDLIVRALAQALMAGVRIGGAEVAAQAIESGMPVTLKMHVDSSDPE